MRTLIQQQPLLIIMLFVTAAALTNNDGDVLLQQRPKGKPMAGLWEFPGGKVDDGETPEQALIRELREELAINVTLDALIPLSFVTHPLNTASNQPDEAGATQAMNADNMLLLLLYRCTQWRGEITPQELQSYRWVSRTEMDRLPMPPADVPLLDFL